MEEIINAIGLENIITGVLVIITAIFGGKFAKVKKKFKQAIQLGNHLSSALEDNKITKKEMNEIKESWDSFVWWKGK